MPWCPNCKTEYQPGVTVCADCKTALVDELKDDLIPFFQADDKKVAEKLAKFFQYSDLEADVSHDEENDFYIVSVNPKKQMEAKKLYQAFYFVERERMAKGESDIFPFENDSEQEHVADEAVSDQTETNTDESASPIIIEEEDDDVLSETDDIMDINSDSDSADSTVNDDILNEADEQNSSTYVMKADQYKDLAGTVWIFLLFGIAGIVFVLLNVLGVLSIFSNWLPNLIMGALFLFFIYVAVSTNNKAKKIKAEIAAEEKLTSQINEWLKNTVTDDFLSKLDNESTLSEINYLKQLATIKDMLNKQFGNQNQAYLDRLIEEYYTRTFDTTVE